MSLAQKGKKKPPRTREHSINISKAKSGKPLKISRIGQGLGRKQSPDHIQKRIAARMATVSKKQKQVRT